MVSLSDIEYETMKDDIQNLKNENATLKAQLSIETERVKPLQDTRTEQLEKEVEILKKRVDYLYEEIRPILMKDKCRHKYVVADEKGFARACYEKQGCLNCEYKGD